MDKWVRLSTGGRTWTPGLGPLDPLPPLGALVNFIYTTLCIHTFASGGIASCTAHTPSVLEPLKKIYPSTFFLL